MSTVVTVNDYLAQRDAEWMGSIHRFLGLSVGLIQGGMKADERRSNYRCDITYTNNSHYNVELKDNSVDLIEEGVALMEMVLETNDLWDEKDPWARCLS
ncbi:hypothetical protein BHE74_00039721 [Ensete ventricosum]|nr:hypothetical protein GW17_00052424 [Ensete ventricosum]RWW53760.1 hypothetical protein BHE74_00039721 [Ensete ventricosum]